MENYFNISKTPNEESQKRIEFIKSLKKGAHIHISAVCGTGMAAVLQLLKQRGFYVSGSDKAFYPPMGDIVRKYADKLYDGYSEKNLEITPELVVIGNALSIGNPEVQEIKKQRIPFASMPEVFNALLIGDREECPKSVSYTHLTLPTICSV